MPRQIDNSDLLAYADGELNSSRRQEVDAALQESPELRARLEGIQQFQQQLKATLVTSEKLSTPDHRVWQGLLQEINKRKRHWLNNTFSIILSIFLSLLAGIGVSQMVCQRNAVYIDNLLHQITPVQPTYSTGLFFKNPLVAMEDRADIPLLSSNKLEATDLWICKSASYIACHKKYEHFISKWHPYSADTQYIAVFDFYHHRSTESTRYSIHVHWFHIDDRYP